VLKANGENRGMVMISCFTSDMLLHLGKELLRKLS